MAENFLKTNSKRKGARGSFNIPRDFSNEGKRFAQALVDQVQQLSGEKGSFLDKAVTFNDLIDSGIAKKNFTLGSGGSDFIIGPGETPGQDFPTAPTGGSASGAFQHIVISWDYPTYIGHSHTEIFVHDSDNFAEAEIDKGRLSPKFLAQTTAAVFSHQVGNGANKYYWIRHVNQNGLAGPVHSTTGLNATTAIDIGAAMASLSETLQDLPGFSALQTLINNTAASAAVIIRSTSAPTTRDDGSAILANDIWSDTDDNNQLYIRNSSNNAWVKARDSSLVSLVGTSSFTGSDVSSALASAQTDIATVTTQSNAIATDRSNLIASLNTANSGSDTTLDAALITERTARVTAEGTKASATALSSLQQQLLKTTQLLPPLSMKLKMLL